MSETTWRQRTAAELSDESLGALIRNEIPAIRISGFATPQECTAFSEAVRTSPDLKAYSVATPTYYLGLVMYEYRQDGGRKKQFFADVPGAAAAQRRLYDKSFDAPQRFIDTIGRHYPGPVAVAQEPGYGDYCPVVVRVASGGVHLHADFAPFNSPDWATGTIREQITWNLYTESPAEGGETTVYNAPWTPADGEDPARGLPDKGVEGRDDVESFTFAPRVGEVVLFNPRNPHRIAPGAPGDRGRISIGSFLGTTHEGGLVMWA